MSRAQSGVSRGVKSSNGSTNGSTGDSPLEGCATAAAAAAAADALAPVSTARQSGVSLSESWPLPFWRSWGGGGGHADVVDGRGSVATASRSTDAETEVEERRGYHCQICLDDRPAEAGFALSACGHTFCRTCLKAYVASKVSDGQVYPTCFHVAGEFDTTRSGEGERAAGTLAGLEEGREPRGREEADLDVEEDGSGLERGGGVGLGFEERVRGREREGGRGRGTGGVGGVGRRGRAENEPQGCGVVVSPSDIKDLLKGDERINQKYDRFLFAREHETARECPRCSKLSVGDPAASSEMRCDWCGAVFCYEHGGAHEGKSCREYIESTAQETQRSMALIGRLTKRCPGCRTPVEKLGGCNQMVCMHCNCSFCWICMEEVDRGTFPVHFQWWNVRGCPNQQLQEDSQQSPGSRRCLKVLSVLQIIVVGPFALLLTVCSSLVCACCLPAFRLSPRQLFSGCISGWGNFVMLLPLLPVLFVLAVLAGVVYILMLPSRLFAIVNRKYRSGKRDSDSPAPRKAGNSPTSSRRRSSSSSSSSTSSKDEGRGTGKAIAGGVGRGDGGDAGGDSGGASGTGQGGAGTDGRGGSGEELDALENGTTSATDARVEREDGNGFVASTAGALSTFAALVGRRRRLRQAGVRRPRRGQRGDLKEVEEEEEEERKKRPRKQHAGLSSDGESADDSVSSPLPPITSPLPPPPLHPVRPSSPSLRSPSVATAPARFGRCRSGSEDSSDEEDGGRIFATPPPLPPILEMVVLGEPEAISPRGVGPAPSFAVGCSSPRVPAPAPAKASRASRRSDTDGARSEGNAGAKKVLHERSTRDAAPSRSLPAGNEALVAGAAAAATAAASGPKPQQHHHQQQQQQRVLAGAVDGDRDEAFHDSNIVATSSPRGAGASGSGGGHIGHDSGAKV